MAAAEEVLLGAHARIESIDTKRVFKDALERKRCLVPADGFFEWKKLGKKKQPIYIHPGEHRFFAFAGLKLANILMSGGSVPRAVAGAVK